jgi:hypothetical protein
MAQIERNKAYRAQVAHYSRHRPERIAAKLVEGRAATLESVMSQTQIFS